MPAILAAGAYLKNVAGLLCDQAFHASGQHGDLGTPKACRALEASVERLLAQAGGRLDAVAHDLHPDFPSTHTAQAIAARLGVPAVPVQHHHAHVAVVLAEQRVDGPVVGLALDGAGLGTDGTSWGGELLWVHADRWRRLGHLGLLALPGGDRAAREPWRMAASALFAMGRGDEIEPRFAPQVGRPLARGVADLLARGVCCPLTSSAGRWFDAAAAALGLCVRQGHEAEAAIALERLAAACLSADPVGSMDLVAKGGVIDLCPVLARLFELAGRGAAPQGALLFHHCLADALAREAARAADETDTDTVALGGGCFLNRVLTARLVDRLHARGLRVLRPQHQGCGDAGLALGQAWVVRQQLASARGAAIREDLQCA